MFLTNLELKLCFTDDLIDLSIICIFNILLKLYELIENALNGNAIQFLYISYDIYVALVSLVACLGPCNIDFHNETLICFSSSHPKPMQTEC